MQNTHYKYRHRRFSYCRFKSTIFDDTLGHIDFMRGKYSVYNKHYILNMLNQMTVDEKTRMKRGDFDALWRELWGIGDANSKKKVSISAQYKGEEGSSRDKYNMLVDGININDDVYTLNDLIDQSEQWNETEWGFPKGRRNPQEKDLQCATREFSEETGYPSSFLKNIQNILPYEEIFTGSNYKSYKHKYYLMNMRYEDTLKMGLPEPSEVSKMEWKTYDECISCIRPYNLEKIRLITKIHKCLLRYSMYMI